VRVAMPNLAYKKYLASFLTYEDQWAYEQTQAKKLKKYQNKETK
jgi:hypothetical protein